LRVPAAGDGGGVQLDLGDQENRVRGRGSFFVPVSLWRERARTMPGGEAGDLSIPPDGSFAEEHANTV
ncbi:MAG: hypothetical protein M3Q54_09805, partial [Actinomycetota bacterium]|nr:hypothetical protein [Actinomycetota bacterium]